MTYQIADGHDQESNFEAFDPQPRCPGLFIPVYITAISGDVYPDSAYYAELLWEDLITAAQYANILSQCGLTTATTNEVTVSLPDAGRDTFSNYNARAVHQRTRSFVQYQRGFYRGVKILLKELVST